MLASIWLTKKGVPAVAVCTEPFTRAVQSIQKIHGVEGLDWAILPHPFGSLKGDDLRQRALAVVRKFYEVVLEPGSAPVVAG